MSGLTFGAFAWILLPLLPALVALYFLKLKRQPRVVSSTFLWSRTLEDLHVNAPFQRMRRSLLLLLQLLVLGLLILAASRPMSEGAGRSGITRVILVDRSASMNVEEDGDTRLELARDAARELIATLEPGDLTAIVAFADRPVTVQAMTDDASRLERAVGGIEPSALPTDFPTALQTAAALIGTAENAEVYVISDGGFGDLSNVPPELELVRLKYIAVGERRDNIGIVELDAATGFGEDRVTEIFASLYNSGEESVPVTLTLYEGENPVDAARLDVAPGKIVPHVFDGGQHVGETLRLEIEPGGALGDDDRAWVRIAEPEPIEVLVVGEANHFLDLVLRANPRLRARRVELGAFTELLEGNRLIDDPADIVIFDRGCPPAPSDRAAIYIDCRPEYPISGMDEPEGEPVSDGASDAGPEAGPARVKGPLEVVDLDRTHPVNRYLRYADLIVSEARRPVAHPGYRSFLEGGEVSLAGALTHSLPGRPAAVHVHLNFDLLRTNWAWLPSFPKFFYNTATWLGDSREESGAARFRTGETLVHFPPRLEEGEADPAFRLLAPGGASATLSRQETGELVFTETEQLGLYRLEADGEVARIFPVALLSRAESEITPSGELRLGSDRVASPEEIPQSRDLWPWAALIALGIVLGEWWVYNRRMTL